ncbi:MAG: GNAT family N-acetyltransferase [Candidatus Obscuribacterales bacterium]|nr:GNAT family N-acetyltransferase [Candidatus Obscuribacterales bacterium]
MESLVIRDAKESDMQAVLAIYNYYVAASSATFDLSPQTEAERNSWYKQHIENDLPVYVAEKAGQILGFAGLSFYHSRCGYRQTVEPCIYIDQSACGSGVGKQLMKRLMTAAQEKGYHAIVALVCSENHSSIGLAKSFGFEQVGQLKEVGRKFDRWLDVTLLQKVL